MLPIRVALISNPLQHKRNKYLPPIVHLHVIRVMEWDSGKRRKISDLLSISTLPAVRRSDSGQGDWTLDEGDAGERRRGGLLRVCLEMACKRRQQIR